MLNCFQKRNTLFYNKNLNDYCRRTTDESIKKLSERLSLERNKEYLEEENDNNKNHSVLGFIIFLSISCFVINLYKRIK